MHNMVNDNRSATLHAQKENMNAKKILYINACVRSASRTARIADALLHEIAAEGDSVEELILTKLQLAPLNEDTLALRDRLIKEADWQNPFFALARGFAEADEIVIAAPYWDGSFPSLLKLYIENIYVAGLVSSYGEDGRPQGLCRAGRLFYVVTAGGPYDADYSYRYIEYLAKQFFGIQNTKLVMAEMLDVDGYDPEKIVEDTIASLHE